MNLKLNYIADWAQRHEIDLDQADIAFSQRNGATITFWHFRESVESFRTVKRAVGGFDPIPPGSEASEIRTEITEGPFPLSVRWYGAYTCQSKTEYKCSPVKFPDQEGEAAVTVETAG